jgi:hypothetical protein
MPDHPVFTAGVVIYGTLALLLIAIPQGLVNWLKDFNPGPAQEALLDGAETLAALSTHVGADAPYRWARKLFLDATGMNED